jgi:hypothetical protein
MKIQFYSVTNDISSAQQGQKLLHGSLPV